jgi:3-phosphoshikimate 1-carboxyvinyltransferase
MPRKKPHVPHIVAPSQVTVEPVERVAGSIRVPGDKSISHRYAMLSSLTAGQVVDLWNYAPGADCHSTLRCLNQLSVAVQVVPKWVAYCHGEVDLAAQENDDLGYVRIRGRGRDGFREPQTALDCGNSGSTMRMLTGLLAAHPFQSTLKGDLSLSRRPMRRVTIPLIEMGAIVMAKGGFPPITIIGKDLRPIEYTMEVASAQVKSAVLLAGMQTEGKTTVIEPAETRDHTERAFRTFGITYEKDGRRITVDGRQTPQVERQRLDVPGDISSAAFWAVAAVALPGSEVEIVDVGLNPTRTGWIDTLRLAGAEIETTETHLANGSEPVGRMLIKAGAPQPLTIGPEQVAGVIDELPVLGALATFPGYGIHVTGAHELRTKESDRITAFVTGLKAMGANAKELPDGFHIEGGERLRGGCHVDAAHDHRLAMAFAVAALGAREPVVIDGADAVAVSYPKFFETLAQLCQQ